MKKLIFAVGSWMICSGVFAQMSGNRVYQNMDEYQRNREYAVGNVFKQQQSVIIDKDSVMYINTAILLNTKADFYVLVLGVNEIALTSDLAMKRINKRIQNCTQKIMESLQIKKEDVYIDFISQTRVFDYDVKTSNNDITATQKQMGFQTKKNIIIKFKNLDDMDALIAKAAEESIYDIIKVDYIVTDVVKLHQQMLEEGLKINNQKKDWYMKTSSIELLPNYSINTDNFYSLYPAKQYATYQAYESSSVTNSSHYESKVSYTKKDMLMDKTFFYDGEDPSKFDKVINPGMPQVGVQFVLQYTMKYLLKRK